MNALQKLETTVHACLDHLNQLRSENERLSREVDETRTRLSAVSDESQAADQKKQYIIGRLSELAQRIERLHIDSVPNE